MKKKVGFLVFSLFVLLQVVQAFFESRSFLSEGDRFLDHVSRVEVHTYVLTQVACLGSVFIVTSVLLFLKLRRINKQLETIERGKQTPLEEQV